MEDSDHSTQGPLSRLMPEASEESDELSWPRRKPSDPRRIVALEQVTLVELLLIVLIPAAVTMVIAKLALLPTDRQCAEQLSVYFEYVEYDFDNAFDSKSIYRGPPTDEREAAWHALTAQHGIEIPADRLASLNRSGDEMEKVREDVGTGYVAILENTIRQYTWLQAGKYKIPPSKFDTTPTGQRMHVDHCIETLRLALMGFGDLTPVLVRRAAASGATRKADFNTHHKCRDFGKIQEWHAENWVVP
ncbi:hypothetical protein F5Y17DRAFT_270200 [Xylariaceae sp. FL0594]|nr:hypothetical protein F5Y17DRAFT_270200 [Xylariaceae sp. FL0594]